MTTKTTTFYSVTYGNWFAGTSTQFDSLDKAKDFYEDVKTTEIWGHIDQVTVVEEKTFFLFKKTHTEEITLDSFNTLHDN